MSENIKSEIVEVPPKADSVGLEYFLAENVEKVVAQEVVISERFKDKEGNLLHWVIKPTTTERAVEMREQCTYYPKKKGRKDYNNPQFDQAKYFAMMAEECVISPPLSSEELQNSYKVHNVKDLLNVMLTAGEAAELNAAVAEANGYDKDFDDLVEEAKN